MISSAPEAVRWDVPFGVGATGDIDDAVLMAPSAVTHANDMNQRLVPLEIVADHPGGVTLQSPPSANVAPPGWYMLFLLNDGVPSVANGCGSTARPRNVPALPPRGGRPGRASGSKLRSPPKTSGSGGCRRTGALRVRVTVNERANVDARLLRGKRRVARKRVQIRAGTRRLELQPRRSVIKWLRDADNPRLRL